MPNDVLALGPFVFEDFAVPDTLPGGGKHDLQVHKLPGGDRYIDANGPDDDDRTFTVKHVGENAMDDVLTLDAMRIAGSQWPYSNGAEARVVVISAFTWKVIRFPNYVESTITLMPVDNPSAPPGVGGATDDAANADLAIAMATALDNVASSPAIGGRPSGISH